jgi:tetratricopeptide (TPR) repeat protein
MKNNVTTVIHPFKLNSFDEVTEVLRKAVRDNKVQQNDLIKFTNQLLNFIDINEITYKEKSNGYFLKVFSEQTGISLNQLNVIMRFLLDEELITDTDYKIQITPRGKIFLISDNISSTTDLIKYYWEKCNWNQICPYNESNKFLSSESRRYLACLLLQLNNCYLDFISLYKKYESLDLVYCNNYSISKEMLNNRSIRFVLKFIFEPIGLIDIITEENEYKIVPTKAGTKVFNYYSYNMVEEYHKLLEDSWECFDRGNFQEAYDIAKSIISVDCNLVETYNVMGCVYIKKREYNKAQAIFNFALDMCKKFYSNSQKNKIINSDSYISIYYNLGLCYFYLGNFIKAMHIFSDIKRTVPNRLENIESIISTIKENIIIS